MTTVETRVATVAEAALAERQFVTPIDVFTGLGWVAKPTIDYWLRGEVRFLDRYLFKHRALIGGVLDELAAWAKERGLQPWNTDFGDRTFTEGDDPAIERRFRTRWAAAEKPAPKIPRPRPREHKAVAADSTWECGTCGSTGELVLKVRTGGGMCLDCAGLGHLVFLPAGDAALTRLARKASKQSVVVVRFNRTRQRTERQGILADNTAIELAAQQRLEEAAADARVEPETFRDDVAAGIRKQFPGCPSARADAIAYHYALRFHGRASRGNTERALATEAIEAAVAASICHVDTDYDDLLRSGVTRDDARRRVADRVHDILRTWREGLVNLDVG